jgi:hypothetical protein
MIIFDERCHIVFPLTYYPYLDPENGSRWTGSLRNFSGRYRCAAAEVKKRRALNYRFSKDRKDNLGSKWSLDLLWPAVIYDDRGPYCISVGVFFIWLPGLAPNGINPRFEIITQPIPAPVEIGVCNAKKIRFLLNISQKPNPGYVWKTPRIPLS